MSAHPFDPRHDLVHTPDLTRERWRESYYFNFYDAKLGLGVYSSIGYRPLKGHSGALHAVWGPARPTLVATERDKSEVHDDTHLVTGLSYAALEPLGAWRIAFDGALNDAGSDVVVGLDAMQPVADSPLPGVPVTYELTFTPDQPAYKYREDPEWDGLFDGHVDEVGRVTGTITVDGETHAFDGRGCKDHSWGVRDWARPKGWRWADMLFEEGPEVSFWRVTFDGTRWIHDGCVYADGATEPVLDFEETLTFAPRERADRPAEWAFRLTTEKRELRGRAEILRVVPLLFPIRDEHGVKATMWNDRTVYRLELDDGRVGVGSAEFQFRVPAEGPVPHPLVAPPVLSAR
jgi:hypothetical protein